MTGSGSRSAFLILDANVLIDYCAADRTVLTLISQHVGRIHVPSVLLEEVDDLDESECDRLHLQLVEPSFAILAGAGKRRPGLSYYDHLCLLAAKEGGWTCVTNDGRLRRECKTDGIRILWGLEPMVDLVTVGLMTAAQAHDVALRIHGSNPLFITVEIVERFVARVNAAAAKKRR
jgi:predicted nucleic acid-binding protein